MPAPFVFLTVLVITVALIIFFGAWAVASDAEGRELNFGFSSSAVQDSETSGDEGSGQASNAFGSNAFGSGAIGADSSDEALSDTWWGQGFLKACPLH